MTIAIIMTIAVSPYPSSPCIIIERKISGVPVGKLLDAMAGHIDVAKGVLHTSHGNLSSDE